MTGRNERPRPTDPQLEAMDLLVRENDRTQVAAKLNISVGATKTRLDRLRRKIGARNDIEAVLIGLEDGWLEIVPEGCVMRVVWDGDG